MYTSPYKLYIDNNYIEYKFIADAAQAWADETNAKIIDANGVEVETEDIKDILNW